MVIRTQCYACGSCKCYRVGERLVAVQRSSISGFIFCFAVDILRCIRSGLQSLCKVKRTCLCVGVAGCRIGCHAGGVRNVAVSCRSPVIITGGISLCNAVLCTVGQTVKVNVRSIVCGNQNGELDLIIAVSNDAVYHCSCNGLCIRFINDYNKIFQMCSVCRRSQRYGVGKACITIGGGVRLRRKLLFERQLNGVTDVGMNNVIIVVRTIVCGIDRDNLVCQVVVNSVACRCRLLDEYILTV